MDILNSRLARMNTEDLEKYHPTSVLETGYDILPFWVSRMILMSTYLLGDIPFKHVYFHGLVRDTKRSKNVQKYRKYYRPTRHDRISTEPTLVRMSLLVGNAAGNDLKLSEDKIKGYKHFSNKIWNAVPSLQR
jgi:valyl-tRNA synthetase